LGKIDAWVAFIIIGREFTINGLRSIVAADGHVIAASKLGKVKTVFQILAIVFILLNDFPFSFLGIYGIGKAILYLALFFTLYSGADYLIKARKVLQI
jgi:CDP-diacylglycerol--glycerol-3-phosphate 3-phosphatidyltransferase